MNADDLRLFLVVVLVIEKRIEDKYEYDNDIPVDSVPAAQY